jgi:hypothetical protein
LDGLTDFRNHPTVECANAEAPDRYFMVWSLWPRG